MHGLIFVTWEKYLTERFGSTFLSSLLEAIQHLQFAGYVASNANELADDLTRRRYWRVRPYWE